MRTPNPTVITGLSELLTQVWGGLSISQITLAVIFFALGVATPPLLSVWGSLGVNVIRKPLVHDDNHKVEPIVAERANKLASAEHRKTEGNELDDSPYVLRKECNDRNLSEFLHDKPQLGMHVVCLSVLSPEDISVQLFPGASDDNKIISSNEFKWEGVRRILENQLDLLESGPLQQPWAAFTPIGERVVGSDDDNIDENKVLQTLVQSEMVIIMEGGSWLWPGVRVGFERTIDLYSVMPDTPGPKRDTKENRSVTIETLSIYPLVLSVKGFISKEECHHVQEIASPTMRYSEVSLMDHDKGKPSSDWRTSQSTFVGSHNDPVMLDLDDRTASLTRIPRNHQEHVQVLRYGSNEKYDAHHDYFNPAMYKNDKYTMENIQNGKRNRIATVFWYLSGELFLSKLLKNPGNGALCYCCSLGP